jgi:antirestriction protein ArdC
MSPERQRSPERKETTLDYQELLDEALTAPGRMGDTYSRFYSYSFLNTLLLMQQGVSEPVNTYKRWGAMDRQVKRGSRAKSILIPMTIKKAETPEEKDVVKFKRAACLFTVSETEGAELPEVEPQDWDAGTALEKLSIEQTAFALINGNVAGYSMGQEFAINPVAKYPLKTTFHELGHILLGHTSDDDVDEEQEYQHPRGVQEVQAEAVAYLVMNELGMAEFMDQAESRGYIQGWLGEKQLDDRAIRQIFSTVDKILKAGRRTSIQEDH